MLQIRGVAAFIFIAVLSSALWLPAGAQSLQSLEDVTQSIESNAQAMSIEDAARIAKFEAARDEMAAKVSEAQGKLDELEARGEALTAEFNRWEDELERVYDQLMTNGSMFGELVGHFRSAAFDVERILASSYASFEYPGRAEELERVSVLPRIPTQAEFELLPRAMLQEMAAQSEVKRFIADVVYIDAGDRVVETELVRIGVFTMATTIDSAFVSVKEIMTEEGRTRILIRYAEQPGEAYRSGIRDLIESTPDEVVRVPIDPFHGILLQVIGQQN